MGSLARALPAGSVLVSLEFTGEGGQLTALTTDPGVVLSTIRGLPNVVSAELVGPVAQEPNSSPTLQRVTVRFRRSAAR